MVCVCVLILFYTLLLFFPKNENEYSHFVHAHECKLSTILFLSFVLLLAFIRLKSQPPWQSGRRGAPILGPARRRCRRWTRRVVVVVVVVVAARRRNWQWHP